ncbi:response regulator [Deinococcus sp. Arct2-2]|uniref:response regulator n=1 Tax=Deinococcus sp. Arct2-2 TaxID=2568653 RepID=UPI0010A4D750|nr:response regulator [Deinococcus sp. Arct2-2]THF68981.1 response regulator [Deinococcus sp. Arct2-2]
MTEPLRVLLIDDDPLDRLLADEAFSMLDDASMLITAESGQAALALLERPDTPLPDVVLLDINMPRMNGFEVLAALKQHPRFCTIPVVMLTTSANPEDVAQAYTLHASGYLIKSVRFQTSLKQVETFIDFWLKRRRSRLGVED